MIKKLDPSNVLQSKEEQQCARMLLEGPRGREQATDAPIDKRKGLDGRCPHSNAHMHHHRRAVRDSNTHTEGHPSPVHRGLLDGL